MGKRYYVTSKITTVETHEIGADDVQEVGVSCPQIRATSTRDATRQRGEK